LGGGQHSLVGEGGCGSQFWRLKRKPGLCILCNNALILTKIARIYGFCKSSTSTSNFLWFHRFDSFIALKFQKSNASLFLVVLFLENHHLDKCNALIFTKFSGSIIVVFQTAKSLAFEKYNVPKSNE
jgi:hypothetical protein